MDPPGLRRLRFPFFDLLVKERWGEAATNERPGSMPPRRCENEAHHPVTRGSLVSIRRLPAHCRTPVHGARTSLISLNRHLCQRLEQDYLRACRSSMPAAYNVSCAANWPALRRRRGSGKPTTAPSPVWDRGTGVIGHLTRGPRAGRNCRDPRGQDGTSPRANGGRHAGCTPGATHRWAEDASALGTTSCTAARMPISAAHTARSATSTSVTMPIPARVAGFAGC